jgi:hypothetical protein
MSLGAETHAREMPAARDGLAAILIPRDDPLVPELRRALDIGFMYGGLIADKTHAAHGHEVLADPAARNDDAPLPETLRLSLEGAIEGLDPGDGNDSHLLFMRIRDIETAYAGSDILAFSLAATQDHMHRQFAEYHRPEKELSRGDTRRLQSLYYAGALVGALLHSDATNLGKAPVEILRAMQGPAESVALRMEFEPDDDLVDAMGGALSSRLAFSYVDSEGGVPYVAAVMNGFQFGPNTVSMPFFIPGMEEPVLMEKIPLADTEALIVRHDVADGAGPGEFGVMTDPERYPEVRSGARIVGLVLKGGEVCVAAYHRAHPDAAVVHGLAAKAAGVNPQDLPYSSGIELAAPSGSAVSRKAGYIALGAGMAMPWALDAVAELTGAGQARWEQDALADLMIAAGFVLYKAARRSLGTRQEQADANYQVLLDQITGYQ